ncbi:MAG: arylsulfatase, partial [Prevotella sp.]|nr:arylsulfatase [Prevotella sp.]
YIEPMNGGPIQRMTGIETGYSPEPQLYRIADSKFEGINVYESHKAMGDYLKEKLEELRLMKSSKSQ